MTVPRTDLLRGTLDMLILKTLSGGKAHGYAIARHIQQVSHDALVVEEGSLYPALHRMERRGWVESEWDVTDTGRRAKFYALTPDGRAALADQSQSWDEYVAALFLPHTRMEEFPLQSERLKAVGAIH